MQLHARFADEGVASSDAIGQAFHLWHAARPPDAAWVWEDPATFEAIRRRAFDAQMAAGRQLETWNQYEQAEDVYGHGVELAVSGEERAPALAGLAWAEHRQAKGDDAWKNRLAAIDAYSASGSVPASLYADMLEIATLNWGYFHTVPEDELVMRLLDDGLTSARTNGDDVSLARLLAERTAFTGDPTGTDEVLALLEIDDPVPLADAAHRTAQMLTWAGAFDRSLELYGRVFGELQPRGAIFNLHEALLWYAYTAFAVGDLGLAREDCQKAQADLARGRSVHTQSHVIALRALLALSSGDWSGLLAANDEFEALVHAHPDEGYCILGGSVVGLGGVARLMAGIVLPNDLAADAARMVDDSELVAASSILLPSAMLGDEAAVDRGIAAYAPGLRLVDRAEVWDVMHLWPALATVMTERWDLLDAHRARLELCAAHGGRLAAAVLEAIDEERAGGPSRHAQLNELGYHGISELLRVRARSRQFQVA